MYIDFKVTAWERIYIKNRNKKNIIDNLLNGKIKSSNDIYNIEDIENIEEDCTFENVSDGNIQMSLEENKGKSTIEVYDDNGVLIYKNGK